MFNIGIIFDADDFNRIFKATYKLLAAARLRAKNLPYQMAQDYISLLLRNIESQRFSSGYKPYHPRYKEWKQSRFSDSRYWILSGDLLRAIRVWRKTSNSWMGGVPEGILDSGGKSWVKGGAKSFIGAYARIIEYGGEYGSGGTHHPRPVFHPTLWEYRQKKAFERLVETRKILKRSWK